MPRLVPKLARHLDVILPILPSAFDDHARHRFAHIHFQRALAHQRKRLFFGGHVVHARDFVRREDKVPIYLPIVAT